MITKNILMTGSICGLICVAFMWTYMQFSGMEMTTGNKMENMHQMPDGTMMMNDGSTGMSMGSMTMDEMVGIMKGKSGKNLEKEFLIGMIPHHKGAVEMAKLLLQDKTISGDIKTFAENIIKAQESEIKMMNTWLQKYK